MQTAKITHSGSNHIRPDRISEAEDLAVRWLLSYDSVNTRSAYRVDIGGWFRFCVEIGIDPLDARRSVIDLYVRLLRERDGLASSSIARKIAALSSYYAFVESEDRIERNPAERVRRPRVGSVSPSTGLDRDELGRLIAAARDDDPRSHALVLLLGLSGLRVSEALGLDVEALSHERGHRTMKITRKGGKVQILPIAPRTVAALDDVLEGRTEGPVFLGATGQRMSHSTAFDTIRRLGRKAGIARPVGPHDCRHSFVALSLDAGATLRDTQLACGHASPATTARYDAARNALDANPTYLLAAFVD